MWRDNRAVRARAEEADMIFQPTRRRLLTASAAAGVALGFGRAAWGEAALTPACHDGDEPTLRQTEGPFFKPRSPERADLIEPGLKGRPIVLEGLVLDPSCRPLAHALVDLWQADDTGDYDNTGFRLRGHQFTDAQGHYRFRTIVPALYTGRTRHFHVKVQPAGARLLTTQLYFPDEPANRRDGLFRSELVMRTATTGADLAARFDFIVAAS
jgi:protocatechuate 3,4-dioxygenase beta subunit